MMYLTPFYFMSTSTLILSTMMAVSSTNWLLIWLAMELNMISFIPMISATTNFQETEASVKYLLVQALGSSLLMLSSMSMWMSHQMFYGMNVILMFSLLMKIGMAPCHLWYPSVMTSIAWIPALLLSTWQKLAPLSIMSFILMKTSSWMMVSLASLNALMGGMMGMNQTHLRTIMAYSSITHMGWMMALIYSNMSIPTIIYFSMYVMLVMPIFLLMNSINAKTINQMNTSAKSNNNQYIIMPILLLSLGGLPPLTGFFPKWFAIYLISPSSFILLMFLIIGSLMNLYYYLNITFSSMLSNSLLNINWLYKMKTMPSITIYISTLCIPLVPIMMM